MQSLLGWQNELRQIDGFRPVVVGGPVEAQDPIRPEKTVAVDHRHHHCTRRAVAGPVRSSPRRRQHAQRRELPQQLPGPRSVPPRRRPARPAIYAAHRRHLFHQSLVRHGRDDSRRRSCRSATSASSSATTAGPASDFRATTFRHGERVAEGERGVWERPLGPGKYPFNTYAGNIVLVPTTNFVLHWITGRTEAHRYDEASSRSTW